MLDKLFCTTSIKNDSVSLRSLSPLAVANSNPQQLKYDWGCLAFKVVNFTPIIVNTVLFNTCQEDVVARVFGKHGLRLDVELSYGRVGSDRKFPYFKVQSIVKTLENRGQLYRLLGFGKQYDTLSKCATMLKAFWCKYRILHGSHQVFDFADSRGWKLSECLPVYLHGDEGTTYKKDGCLVLSFHSSIGIGTVSQKKMGPVQQNERVEANTNFAGHALCTRFMLAALLRVSRSHKLHVLFILYFVTLDALISRA